jgi:hypothetical protein
VCIVSFLVWKLTLYRFGQKHVLLLDCPVQLAKEVIVGHVQGVALPRRTHHYLISGLVSYVVDPVGFYVFQLS